MSTSVTAPPSQRKRRQILAGVVGHTVEWFDWSAYAFLAVYFSSQIFAADADPSVAILEAFTVFAIGFLARPFGGLVLGALGDRYGRRAAMTVSIGMMGGGSLLIALAPTYQQAGVLAPITLAVARIIQGLSAGGEWGAASSFIAEAAPSRRRGLFSSFLYVGSNLGKILLTLVGTWLVGVLGEAAMEGFGWRILFLIGFLLAVAGWWIRRSTEETGVHVAQIRAGTLRRPGMLEFLRKHPRQTLQVIGLSAGPAVAIYTMTAFLPTFAVLHAGVERGDTLRAATIALVVFTLAQPLAGALSDRIGRKPLLLISTIGVMVGIIPILFAVQSFLSLLLVQSIALAVLACSTSIAAAVMAEIVPGRIRVSGIGFPYALSVAIFGGLTPMIATAVTSNGHVVAFGVYVIAAMTITLVTIFTIPETAKEPLPA